MEVKRSIIADEYLRNFNFKEGFFV